MAASKLSFLESVYVEIFLRLCLFGWFQYTQEMEPFHRVIQPEEWWLYKNPRTESYVSTNLLYIIIILIPVAVILLVSFLRRDSLDMGQAILACSLGMLLTGFITNTVKVMVGRPRPDFFFRCFPDGIPTKDYTCKGETTAIIEGRKSFPSGHSSWVFSAFGFVSLYLAGKLHTFEGKHRGHSWRLLTSLVPLMTALTVAISRTMDYHHHWQDVTVGSLLGLLCAYVSYYQYYPPLHHADCDKPLIWAPAAIIHRTYSDSRIAQGTRSSWPLEDTKRDTIPLLEVKEM